MTDIRVAAEQARVALTVAKKVYGFWGFKTEPLLAALASLEAALAAQPEQQQGLVAASPAAAAPTGFVLVPVEPTPEMCAAATEQGGYDNRRGTVTVASNIYRAMVAASPVAPVGAPTDLGAMWDRFIALRSKNLGVQVKNLIGSAEAMRDDFINANRAQGCELATDATKQTLTEERKLLEDMLSFLENDWDVPAELVEKGRTLLSHLAVNDAAEDFRRRPASSEAAPSAAGSVPINTNTEN